MGKCHKFDWVRAFVGGILFASIQGCAFFSDKPDQPPIPSSLAGTTLTVPLPVEIAKDISILASGGSVTPINPPLPASRNPSQAVDVPSEPEQNCPCDEAQVSSGEKKKPEPRPKGKAQKSKKPSGPTSNEEYMVKRDDTLMKISFEKFGNVYRWREIFNENRDRIPDFNQLVEGTILKIKGVEYVVIERNGLPYLIRRNDTLTKISRGIYGTPKRWKHLWDNNRQLIHDPDRIYAGFTLYYQPDGIKKPAETKLNLKGPLRSRVPAAKK